MNAVIDAANARMMSDAEVVERILCGETRLFEIVMRRYNQRLFRVVRGIIRDDSEAEDVVQEAYVNAYSHLRQFAGRAKFSTWLTRIAINEALARARRDARLEQLDPADRGSGDRRDGENHMDRLKSPEPDPERQAVNGELRQALESAIDTLPPAYRSVFVMREVEELNTAETAECLDLTEEAVKVRLHRARAMLRHALMEAAGQVAPQAFRFDGARCDRIVRRVMERIGRTRE